MDDLENRSQRLNLVFFDICNNEPKETWQTSDLVKSVCEDNLKHDSILIERAHQVGAYRKEGTYREEDNRPIAANFASWKARESVLQNAHKFKDTGLSVSEDLSHAVREKLRLWNYTRKTAKQKVPCKPKM